MCARATSERSGVPSRSDYVHPETGEILSSEEDWRSALSAVEEQLAPLYRLRRSLREAHADRFAPAAMPTQRRNRSEIQERVARCPRCGAYLESNL